MIRAGRQVQRALAGPGLEQQHRRHPQPRRRAGIGKLRGRHRLVRRHPCRGVLGRRLALHRRPERSRRLAIERHGHRLRRRRHQRPDRLRTRHRHGQVQRRPRLGRRIAQAANRELLHRLRAIDRKVHADPRAAFTLRKPRVGLARRRIGQRGARAAVKGETVQHGLGQLRAIAFWRQADIAQHFGVLGQVLATQQDSPLKMLTILCAELENRVRADLINRVRHAVRLKQKQPSEHQ